MKRHGESEHERSDERYRQTQRTIEGLKEAEDVCKLITSVS